MIKFDSYVEAMDARGYQYDPLQSTGMQGNIINAIEKLQKAEALLTELHESGKYSLKAAQDIRKLLLSVVRDDIDPMAFGHMPDQRHY